jgi:hypothetical protein
VAYQFRPWCGGYQVGLNEEVKEIAWKAQDRLHLRYRNSSHEGRTSHRLLPPWEQCC